MKSILTIALIIIFATSYSQDTLIDPIEIPPEFPGGQDSMFCYIEKHLDYSKLSHLETAGTLLIFFIVESDGTITDLQINPAFVRRLSNLILDSTITDEFTRLFKEMPKWTPATVFGSPARSSYVVTIRLPYSGFKCPDFETYGDIVTNPDALPYFPFGEGKTNKERLVEYIHANMKWPMKAANCQGWILVQAVVEKTGELTNPKIIRKLCPGFDEEALRVVKDMPDWKPGIKDGEPVRTATVIPVRFVLMEE